MIDEKQNILRYRQPSFFDYSIDEKQNILRYRQPSFFDYSNIPNNPGAFIIFDEDNELMDVIGNDIINKSW